MNLIGDVLDKDCIIVDDICDSGGTLMGAAKELKSRGAKSVRAFITHGLLGGSFYNNLRDGIVDELVVTDTVRCHSPEEESKPDCKVTRISSSKIIADAIFTVFGKGR